MSRIRFHPNISVVLKNFNHPTIKKPNVCFIVSRRCSQKPEKEQIQKDFSSEKILGNVEKQNEIYFKLKEFCNASIGAWKDFLQPSPLNKSLVYSGIFLPGVIIATLLTIGVYAVHVPKPPKRAVQKIIGSDPALDDSNPESVVTTIAHRGAGLDAPENSLEAFKQCHDKGVNFIEFDVTLTADCVPVVFHDDSLERMTGIQEYVRCKTYKELKALDIAVKHPYKEEFPQTKIPTLDETIQLLVENGQLMFIDIKDNDPHMVDVILSAYERCPLLYEKAITTSFFPNIIYLIRKRNPKIVCSLAWRPYAFTYTSYSYATGPGPRRADRFYKHYLLCALDWLHENLLSTVTYYILGISFILLHKDAISGRVVRDWREKDVRVIAWTVNQPLEKRYFSRVLKITYMTDTLIRESSDTSLPHSVTDHLLGEPSERRKTNS